MTETLTVLILGGYGKFGGRLVELLTGEERLLLLIAGRSRAKAEAFCAARLGSFPELLPACFDRDGDIAAQLAETRPDVLVDASGPFQAYGAERYRVVEACLAADVHYIDLADATGFVAGIGALDAAALALGKFAISGASTFPALSAAAVRALSGDFEKVTGITGGIAPSPYAGVGRNVVQAVASYAGRRIPLRADKVEYSGHPFAEQLRLTVRPPGGLPLHNTLFSLVDVPDPQVLGAQWPSAEQIWMGAGPAPELLHRLLIAAAWLVRLRLLPSLAPLVPLMHWAANRWRWGENRGGMFIEVTGFDAEWKVRTRSWHLSAEGDDGPLIPSMAAAALLHRMLAGKVPAPGARAAIEDIELADYQPFFETRRIRTGIRNSEADAAGPLYRRVLGAAWAELPGEIRAMHNVETEAVAAGRGSVERGGNILARLAGAIVGFPRAGADTEVTVRFRVRNGVETWTRRFGRQGFASRQYEGRGRPQGLVCEAFGPLVFGLALVTELGVTEGERLSLVLRRWTAFGIPLPLWLAPRMTAHETVEEGRFCFHVELSHPLCGRIVRYRGWLKPVEGRPSPDLV